MCQSMVNIQSPTAEIRRGKKEDRNHRMKIYMVSLLHRATINNQQRFTFQTGIGRRSRSMQLTKVHWKMVSVYVPGIVYVIFYFVSFSLPLMAFFIAAMLLRNF